MESEIDIDLLISLVEMKPVLWDKTLEDYKSRNLTTNAWRDVCCGLYKEFENLNEKEKNEFGNLQNIYFCFTISYFFQSIINQY